MNGPVHEKCISYTLVDQVSNLETKESYLIYLTNILVHYSFRLFKSYLSIYFISKYTDIEQSSTTWTLDQTEIRFLNFPAVWAHHAIWCPALALNTLVLCQHWVVSVVVWHLFSLITYSVTLKFYFINQIKLRLLRFSFNKCFDPY